MEKKSIFLAVVVLVFACFATSAQSVIQPSFQGLGDLPGGGFSSQAHGVSADGSVIVGYGTTDSGPEAFRWESNVMTGLGDLPGGWFWSQAWKVSSNGLVVVGRSESSESWESNDFEAFRWQNGVMVGIGDLPGGDFSSCATDVSGNGSVVVGYSESSYYDEAFRWTANDGMVGLGKLPRAYYSRAYAVSEAGSVVVGSSQFQAFRWENDIMVGLGYLAGSLNSSAYGISADGSVIVGNCELKRPGFEAFRWENGVMAGIGDLPGGEFASWATDVSDDGSVIVGYSITDGEFGAGNLVYEAFIWDTLHDMRNLKDVFTTEYGLDLSGWTLREARAISDDGLTIVGWGYNPSGKEEGWIATIPEPGTIVLFGLSFLVLRKRRF